MRALARSAVAGGVAGAIVLATSAAAAEDHVAASDDAAPEPPEVGFDLDRIPKTPFEILPWLNIGAQLRFDSDFAVNIDLDESVNDNLALFQPRPELYISIAPTDQARVFSKLQYREDFELDLGTEDWTRDTRVELEELFLLVTDVWEGTSVQVGRQRTRDPREWLFDQEFDSARVYWRDNPFAVQAFAGGITAFPRLLNDTDRDDDTVNYFLGAYYAPAEESQIAAYTFIRDDLGEDNESPHFFGIQGSGRTDDNIGYWFEAAYVSGYDGALEIDGYGIDVGLFYIFHLPLRPTITGGFAYGTGDSDLTDGVDGNFRQTGLQDNSSRFHGVTSFSIYGELFDPELSNMAIYTAGVGIRPTPKSSIDLVFHWYEQAVAAPNLRDVGIDADPNGVDKTLGSEIDLVIGWREIKNLRVELIGAAFFPGGAFPGADNAYLAELDVRLQF